MQQPAPVIAAFERRLEEMEKTIRELKNQTMIVIKDEDGVDRVVIGNLRPITGILDFGIALWDDEENRWSLLEPEIE